MLQRAFLLLGSNRGNRLEMLKQASGLIELHTGKIINSSSVYETAPWGFTDKINFLNQVHCIETLLSPYDLLAGLLRIETTIGRTRHGKNYTSRLIDIDILFYEHYVLDHEHLTIPHPRLHERLFTLIPLAEIAGDFVHPVLKLSINELLMQCGDQSEVRIISTDPCSQKIKTA